jgi:hypothetical protein
LRRILPVLLGIVCVVIVVAGMRAIIERRDTAREIQGLRNRMYEARLAADSCRSSLALEEGRLLHFDEMLDSMRSEVRSFEELDARGVPQEQYSDYMASFESYNDSAATWDARAEQLRRHEAECREIVEGHNVVGDSLRARIREANGG